MKKLGLIFVLFLAVVPVVGQSVNQDFPSPVLQNELSGIIPARDIGDSRLTRHFYTFFANNGDLSVEVEAANMNGDVDFFAADTLRPLSKISIYAGSQPVKTNRIVYFRQRQQVVMRVEGRTPNDDPAQYRIKFAGTFAAAIGLPQPPEDLIPKASEKLSNDATARVNSAGAIIEVIKPEKPVVEPAETASNVETQTSVGNTPEAETTAAATTPKTRAPRRRNRANRRTSPPKAASENQNAAEEAGENKTETAVTGIEEEARPSASTARRTRAPRATTTRRTPARRTALPRTETPETTEPLSNVRLIILLKDGNRLERPMNEVLRVNVDKGRLTVTTKDGKIERFALLDVEKMSIEQ